MLGTEDEDACFHRAASHIFSVDKCFFTIKFIATGSSATRCKNGEYAFLSINAILQK